MDSFKYRIKKTFYLIKFFSFFLFRGKANKIPKNIKRVLIVQPAKLGDMVCTTPLFREIKNKYSEMKITVACSSVNKEILKGNPNVDDYLDLQQLKNQKNKFDVAIITGVDFFSAVDLFTANIKCISIANIIEGYSPFVTIDYKLILPFFIKSSRRIGAYAPQERLDTLSILNIHSTNTKKDLYFSKDAQKKAEELIKENYFYVGLSLSAGNKIKEWPINRFVELTKYILQKPNTKIVLIGSKDDKEYSSKFLSNFQDAENIIDLTGEISIDELKAVISKLNIFIAVDTGPIYIAEAFNVPTIDIIGPVDQREQPPVGEKNIVLYDENRKEAAIHILNARDYDRAEARRQVEFVTVDMVKFAFDRIIKKE
jgi:heptosyltransferase II